MTAPDPEEIGRLTALASWQRGELDQLRAHARLAGRSFTNIGQFADYLLDSAIRYWR